MRITMAAPAKVNLWLRVGPKQAHGYHPLDTLFCSLTLADGVVVRTGAPTEGIRLVARAAAPLEQLPEMGQPEQNLAVRAARLFHERTGGKQGLELRLTKRLPAAGGLGGGSSDAGAVLRALHQQHLPRLPDHDLLELAAELGSDVPFFVSGRSLAIGRGRGEQLTPMTPLPSRPVVLVLPPFSVSTADAYRWLDDDRAGAEERTFAPPPTEGVTELDWAHVTDRAVNDLEPVVFARHPRLGRLRDFLIEAGAQFALMAGSGSSVFGVFESQGGADTAAQRICREDPSLRVVVTSTRAR